MSARIGSVVLVEDAVTHVSASTAGVEVHTEARLTYDPINARNYAALLVRAAEEVERMRTRRGIEDAIEAARGIREEVGRGIDAPTYADLAAELAQIRSRQAEAVALGEREPISEKVVEGLAEHLCDEYYNEGGTYQCGSPSERSRWAGVAVVALKRCGL